MGNKRAETLKELTKIRKEKRKLRKESAVIHNLPAKYKNVPLPQIIAMDKDL